MAVVALLVASVSASAGWYYNNQRATENHQLIVRLQASRVESCRQTYGAFREVFDPFLPPPEKQSPKMRADVRRFNQIVDRLVAGCGQQTRAKGTQP